MCNSLKEIGTGELVASVRELADAGYRLVQISCTKLPDGPIEINYSFGLEKDLINFRCTVRANEEIPSVSGVYWPAALYENEMHDLFGLNIAGMVVDYNGAFYRVSQPAPFLSVKQPSVPVPGAGPSVPTVPKPPAPGQS